MDRSVNPYDLSYFMKRQADILKQDGDFKLAKAVNDRADRILYLVASEQDSHLLSSAKH